MIESGATISDDGVYRYRLWRRWDRTKPVLGWVMLNPSTADANVDDPTIRRVIRFSERYGAGGALVGNLYALRATDPRELDRHPDPIGRDNWDWLEEARTECCAMVAAWGVRGMERWESDGLLLAGAELLCLGTTKDGAPRHPLYVRRDAEFVVWRDGYAVVHQGTHTGEDE